MPIGRLRDIVIAVAVLCVGVVLLVQVLSGGDDDATPRAATTAAMTAPTVPRDAPDTRLDSDKMATLLATATPQVAMKTSDARTLFLSHNLGKVLSAIQQRYDDKLDVVGGVLHPGELDVLVVPDGDHARLLRASADGVISTGPVVGYVDHADAVYLSQLKSGVPERLDFAVRRHGHGPATVMRMNLATRDRNAGWYITTEDGTRYVATLDGLGLHRG